MPIIPSQGGPQGMLPTYTRGYVTPYYKAHVGRCVSGKAVLQSWRRHRKAPHDSIYGITKPVIRRLARRGGVKRISTGIYNEIRCALKRHLETIIGHCVSYVLYRVAKTVTLDDVIHSLRVMGRPIWGLDSNTYAGAKKLKP